MQTRRPHPNSRLKLRLRVFGFVNPTANSLNPKRQTQGLSALYRSYSSLTKDQKDCIKGFCLGFKVDEGVVRTLCSAYFVFLLLLLLWLFGGCPSSCWFVGVAGVVVVLSPLLWCWWRWRRSRCVAVDLAGAPEDRWGLTLLRIAKLQQVT